MPIENPLTINDLTALVQIAGELTSQIDLKDLLQLILSKSGELSDSPDGAVLLYNAQRNSLYFAGAIGNNSALLLDRFGEFAQNQIPIVGSKAGTVFSSGESIITDYVPDDVDHFKGVDKETDQPTQSMICVPLIASGQRLGVVQLLNKRSGKYDERDRILLKQFANYAAVALRNASLFEELIAHMGLYTSPQFRGGVTELLNQLKSPARTEKLTVLFADMRGFRLLCQVINNPEKIIAISSQFASMLSQQVLLQNGIVNKFLGDGILALFRGEDHAYRSVMCAFSMLTQFSRLKLSWDEESIAQLDFLDIGIGITTDEMIIGTIGDAKINDFTVIGTAVNLAAAFEKEARGGKRILVDHLTYLAVKDAVAEIEGPVIYELRQPDQRTGNFYKQYHLKLLAPNTNDTIFISHSQADRQFVENELLPLLDKNGIKYWYSNEDIKAGESWVHSINNGLDLCNWVFVVISQNSSTSKWVKEEVDMAASRSQLLNKIVPIKLDDTKIEDVNPFLRHKQSIDVRNKEKYIKEILALFN